MSMKNKVKVFQSPIIDGTLVIQEENHQFTHRYSEEHENNVVMLLIHAAFTTHMGANFLYVCYPSDSNL